jgi:hypothetical protein
MYVSIGLLFASAKFIIALKFSISFVGVIISIAGIRIDVIISIGVGVKMGVGTGSGIGSGTGTGTGSGAGTGTGIGTNGVAFALLLVLLEGCLFASYMSNAACNRTISSTYYACRWDLSYITLNVYTTP